MPANIVQFFRRDYGTSDRTRDRETFDCCTYNHRDNRAGTFVYPELADSIIVSTGATAYTYGGLIDIVPNGIIPTEWRIVDIHVSDVEQKDADYVLKFFPIGSLLNIMTIKVRRNNVISSSDNHAMQSLPVPGGIGVQVKAAIGAVGSKDISISVVWKLTGAE